MGYFDSPKNQAKWDIEIRGLRAQRDTFEKNPEMKVYNAQQNPVEKIIGSSTREPVTYPQLVREEQDAAAQNKNGGREKSNAMERSLEQRAAAKTPAQNLTLSSMKAPKPQRMT